MASTKNINNSAEYNCEKKKNKDVLNYRLDSIFSEQKKPMHMFVLGSIPTKMNSNHFSYNSIDMESSLRGIRSSNLEGPSFNPELKKKDFYTQDIFENNLRDNVYVPRPFFHNSNTRYGYVF